MHEMPPANDRLMGMTGPMSRRAALRILAVGSSGLLVACVSGAPPAPTAAPKPAEAPKPTEAPKPAAPATQAQPAAPAAQAQATQPAKPAEAAKPAAATQAAPAAAKKLSGTLRLHVRVGSEEDTLKEMLPKFTEDTGVEVKVETFPTNDYFTKLQTLIGGGTAGDVWWCAYRNTARFAATKVIMPLDDLVARDKFDMSQYFPGAVEASKYQGALYALPFKESPGASVLYYNANQVKDAGITMPEKQFKSWDDFIATVKPLYKETGGKADHWPLYLQITTAPTNTLQLATMFFRSWGTDTYTEDGKKSLFNEPPARDAIRFVADLMLKHKVAAPGQEITANVEDLLIAQRVSMVQAHSSTKSVPTKIGGKFEVKNMLFPPGPSGKLGTQAVVDDIVINAKTTNPDAAWELAKFLCSKEVGVRLGGGTGGTASGTSGGRRDVFNDPRLMANPLHPVFLDLVEAAPAIIRPANLREEEVASELHQRLMPIWLGERQPDDAFFVELNGSIQDVLDRPMV
jgi:ABC-type glycerol-3-phosphate transport system substrate-binding protein